VRWLRGNPDTPSVLQGQVDIIMIGLPIRMGGLGITSYAKTAAAARQASSEVSQHLNRIAYERSLMTSVDRKLTPVVNRSFTPQKELCDKIHEQDMDRVMSIISPASKLQLADNCGELSLKWLHVIATTPDTHLTDEMVELGLKAATLDVRTETSSCDECGESWSSGHEQVCQGGPKDRVRRHDRVKDELIRSLKSDGHSVEREQHFQPTTNQVRTDFTVTRSQAVRSSLQPREEVHYDVSIVAPNGRNIRRKLSKLPSKEDLGIKEMIAFLHKEVLPEREKAKRTHYDRENKKAVEGVRKKTVVPILMTSGGTVHKDMSVLLGSLRKQTRFYLRQRLSILLLEARCDLKWKKYII
jgi:hypothetical protein